MDDMDTDTAVYNFALLSVILIVLIPVTFTAFDLTPTVEELPAVAQVFESVINGVLSLFGFLFKTVFFVLKYATLAVLYIANGLTLGFSSAVGDAIDATTAFFVSINTATDDIVTGIQDTVTEWISIYTYLPSSVAYILLVPLLFSIAYAGLKLLRGN